MGMFDWVEFKNPKFCSHCGRNVGKDFQTKSLDNMLLHIKEGVPLPRYAREQLTIKGAWQFSDEGYGIIEVHTICPKCSKYCSYNVTIRKWTLTDEG